MLALAASAVPQAPAPKTMMFITIQAVVTGSGAGQIVDLLRWRGFGLRGLRSLLLLVHGLEVDF